MEVCPECLARLQEEYGISGLDELAAMASPTYELELARERQRARSLLKALRDLPPDERLSRVGDEPRFWTWGVVDGLLARSRDAWSSDSEEARRTAELALAVLGRIDSAVLRPEVRDELSARAWAYLGNAHRIQSDFRGAAEAFAVARQWSSRSGGDPLVKAEVMSLETSLHRAVRSFDRARRLASEAAGIYLDAGENHPAARVMINQAICLRLEGRFDEALATTEKALFLVDRDADLRLYFLLSWARVQILFESGRRSQAEAAAKVVRELVDVAAQPLDRVRWTWYTGRMAVEGGSLDDAETIFRQVRQSFIERGIGYDAALASLDLALVYARQGRTDEIKALGAQMLPIFESREVHREALGALLLFRRAAEAEVATLHLLREVKDFLEAARGRPDLRFPDLRIEGPGDL